MGSHLVIKVLWKGSNPAWEGLQGLPGESSIRFKEQITMKKKEEDLITMKSGMSMALY